MDPLKNHSFFSVKVTRASSGLCSIPRSAWHFLPRSLQVPRRKQCKSRSLELWKTQAVKAQMLNSAKWKITPKEDWNMDVSVFRKPPKLSPTPQKKKWRPPLPTSNRKKKPIRKSCWVLNFGWKNLHPESMTRFRSMFLPLNLHHKELPRHVCSLLDSSKAVANSDFQVVDLASNWRHTFSQGKKLSPHFPLKPPPSSLVQIWKKVLQLKGLDENFNFKLQAAKCSHQSVVQLLFVSPFCWFRFCFPLFLKSWGQWHFVPEPLVDML